MTTPTDIMCPYLIGEPDEKPERLCGKDTQGLSLCPVHMLEVAIQTHVPSGTGERHDAMRALNLLIGYDTDQMANN